MTHLVNDACVKCKHMDCVTICPADCFHEGENMLVINAELCIDCGICIPECPVDGIIQDYDDTDGKWTAINAKYSKLWPLITTLGDVPPDAEKYADETGKFEKYFSEEPGKGDA